MVTCCIHNIPPCLCGLFVTTGCGSLTVPNGAVTFTDRFRVGSIATHTCDVGYQPQDSNNTIRMCEMTGWNASDFTCQS